MAKPRLKLTICRTCVRDNYGEGIFSNIDLVEKTYKERLKEGRFGHCAEIALQNCFTECENFHCVQLADEEMGFRLKKISNLDKINEVSQWVKQVKDTGRWDLPEELIPHLIEPIKP